MHLLIIEDDRLIVDTLLNVLEDHYTLDIAHTGKVGLFKACTSAYDLILLDLGLPDIPGDEVCRRIRNDQITTPILILTGSGDTDAKVNALDAGADDYVTKPFQLRELLVRIRAVLRRGGNSCATNRLTLEGLTLDTVERKVVREGRAIALRRKEFDLLEYMLRNPGRVLTRDMILEHIWDSEVDSFTNFIDVHVKYLRDRIDKPFDKKLIKTVHGLGYKIEA